MTSEQRRAHNAQLKAIRAKTRREAAKRSEESRRADRDRITALRLKGTALDQHAKKVKAAVGKKAIAKQRAEAAAAQKRAAAAAAAFRKKVEKDFDKQAERMQDAHEPGRNQPQVPKEIEGQQNRVVGSIYLQKWQDALEALGTVGGLIFGAGIIKNNIQTTLGLIGDTARFENSDYVDCIGPIDAARDLLNELDTKIIEATDALDAVDLEGIISVFSESRRARK